MMDFQFRNGLVVCLVNDKFVPVIPGDATQIQQAILSEVTWFSIRWTSWLGER